MLTVVAMNSCTGLECFSGLLDALEEETLVDCEYIRYRSKKCRKQQRYLKIVERKRLARGEERRRHRRKQIKSENAEESLRRTLQIYVDFEFAGCMSDKEIAKLVRQMGRVWGLQKRNSGLQVTLLSPDERFLFVGRRKLTGFDHFNWTISHQSIDEISTECRLVYLSPDSQLDALLDVKSDEIYIIGGLVDETGAGSLSRCRAEKLGLIAQRLPIQEFLRRRENGTFNLILTINQVIEILVRYMQTKNWPYALSVVPKRTGFEVPKLST